MSEHVKSEVADGVMTLTFQRPEKKNALSGAMYDALSNAVRQAEIDASVRVVLFQGEGDSFTAGNDLADFARRAKKALVAVGRSLLVVERGQGAGPYTLALVGAGGG